MSDLDQDPVMNQFINYEKLTKFKNNDENTAFLTSPNGQQKNLVTKHLD